MNRGELLPIPVADVVRIYGSSSEVSLQMSVGHYKLCYDGSGDNTYKLLPGIKLRISGAELITPQSFTSMTVVFIKIHVVTKNVQHLNFMLAGALSAL